MSARAMLQLPLLFYMVGLPGSGKTTFAETFCRRNKIEHLHADRLGFELYRLPTFSPEERQLIMREMNRRAYDKLQGGKSVIYDAGINSANQREMLRRLAKKAGTDAVGIWVRTPQNISLERMAKPRLILDIKIVFDPNNPKSRAAYNKSIKSFEPPKGEPNIVQISGQADYDSQRDAVLNFIFPRQSR